MGAHSEDVPLPWTQHRLSHTLTKREPKHYVPMLQLIARVSSAPSMFRYLQTGHMATHCFSRRQKCVRAI